MQNPNQSEVNGTWDTLEIYHGYPKIRRLFGIFSHEQQFTGVSNVSKFIFLSRFQKTLQLHHWTLPRIVKVSRKVRAFSRSCRTSCSFQIGWGKDLREREGAVQPLERKDMISWIYPPPSNSGKWRFRLGFPTKKCNISGGDCCWVEGRSKDILYPILDIEIVSILVSYNRHLDSFGVHVGK